MKFVDEWIENPDYYDEEEEQEEDDFIETD